MSEPTAREIPASPAAAVRPGHAPGGSRTAGAAPGHGPENPAIPWAQPTASRGPASRRRRRVTENDEYAAFARRVLHAWARRVAAGDIDAITAMATAARELDNAIRQAVTGLRGKGYSWAEIATRLGITRQAAHQRWGTKPGTTPPP